MALFILIFIFCTFYFKNEFELYRQKTIETKINFNDKMKDYWYEQKIKNFGENKFTLLPLNKPRALLIGKIFFNSILKLVKFCLHFCEKNLFL